MISEQALEIDDLKLVRDGYVAALRRSKTDQEGKGREIAIPYGANPETCPVRTILDWLNISGLKSGPLFKSINRHGHLGSQALTSHAVALIVKRNSHIKEGSSGFSGHSLRAGFATAAAMAGVQEYAIMKQTGHKRLGTLKNTFIQEIFGRTMLLQKPDFKKSSCLLIPNMV